MGTRNRRVSLVMMVVMMDVWMWMLGIQYHCVLGPVQMDHWLVVEILVSSYCDVWQIDC